MFFLFLPRSLLHLSLSLSLCLSLCLSLSPFPLLSDVFSVKMVIGREENGNNVYGELKSKEMIKERSRECFLLGREEENVL